MVIETKYDPPPVPLRFWDWTATKEGYSGDPYEDEPCGWGPTEAIAIEDLKQQLLEEEESL
jgi:hypothetical protein|tara:strand:- start:273 stop:455 length:183 start_codon:yes stop_codon:yes gene_type:complete